MDKHPRLARPGPLLRLAFGAAAIAVGTLTLGSQVLLAQRYDEAGAMAARTPAPTAQAPAASQPRL